MTEEIASTPGWVDERLDELFSQFPPSEGLARARQAYAACLASHKQAAAPSDLLGTEFNDCRAALRRGLRSAGLVPAAMEPALDALEAEIAGGS